MADDIYKTARSEIRQLRQELRRLKKTRQRLHATSTWKASERLQQQAALTYSLTGETSWAVTFVTMQQTQQTMRRKSALPRITARTITEWYEKHRHTTAFADMKGRLTHPLRNEVDDFLMESMVYEMVLTQNKKGIVVPTDTVFQEFARVWALRPQSAKTARRLLRLQNNTLARKSWARSFRRRWRLRWGKLPASHGVTARELSRKARTNMLHVHIS